MKFFILFFLNFLFVCAGHSQTTGAPSQDSSRVQTSPVTMKDVEEYSPFTSAHSILTDDDKKVVYDIEQYKAPVKSPVIFFMLLMMLGIITYLKVAFSKDLEELFQAVVNQNLSQQIFRSRAKEISFSSALLSLNFIVVISLYVWFILVRYFNDSPAEKIPAIVFIIFLFTFFYFAKLGMVKLAGWMFEVNEVCDEYIFNFTTMCKTLGLTLLPALFVFYTAPVRFFNFTFFLSLFICVCMAGIVAWRGLSTGYKLLYSNVYHFFIYVCVVEISPIFLLFKLLTKTII